MGRGQAMLLNTYHRESATAVHKDANGGKNTTPCSPAPLPKNFEKPVCHRPELRLQPAQPRSSVHVKISGTSPHMLVVDAHFMSFLPLKLLPLQSRFASPSFSSLVPSQVYSPHIGERSLLSHRSSSCLAQPRSYFLAVACATLVRHLT